MWNYVLIAGMALFVVSMAKAEPGELTGPKFAGAMSAPLSDDARLERRERMHKMREALRAEHRKEMRLEPSAEQSAVKPGQRLRLRRGEQLKRLPPEERRRLRQEMQDAARKLYQP